MKRLVAAFAFAALASSAFALTELSSGPIFIIPASDFGVCEFTSTSAKPITVDVIMLDDSANAIVQTQFNAVPSGQSRSLISAPTSDLNTRCDFLFSGPAKNIHADMIVYANVTDLPLVSLPAN